MSGQTIEVINTDAEGRLVLGDVLWYAQETYSPRLVIDLATLTGAIMIALGTAHAGLFANDDALADKLLAAGKATGEKLWRMPLGEDYDSIIDSDVADMKNVGARYGGSITAAQFIQRFVEEGHALGASRHRRRGLVGQGQAHRCPRARPASACACSTR